MSVLSSDMRTLSREAYIYLYPLVTMEATRRLAINTPSEVNPGFGPANMFHHLRAFPDASFRAVVRPNFDTLYSSAWLDLTGGPVQIHLPDSGDRYYLMPMLDMWTDVFAVPGKRTTGTGAQDFVIVPPGYQGTPPAGVQAIAAPTPYVWVIGRTQTNGPGDYAAVAAFQDGMTITAPARGASSSIESEGVPTGEPLRFVNGMSGVEFFRYASRAMSMNPPHATDGSQVARMALLGLVPGQEFDAGRLSSDDLAELEAGATDGRERLISGVSTLAGPVNGWVTLKEGMGVYGNDYFRRALITLVGLGANPAEDAVYPLLQSDADGAPPTGENDYVIHFDADALPPVNAFWSITMYDAEGFQAANEIDRYAIGDRDQLAYNPDGSLDIYVQHANPGPERASNWLPSPLGPLGITLRLYAPKPAVLDGTWNPPPVRKTSR